MKNQSPNEPTTEKKVFDRTVCFTCFGDYVDTLDTIAEQSGPEIALPPLRFWRIIACTALSQTREQTRGGLCGRSWSGGHNSA